jgi:hypothetical protein
MVGDMVWRPDGSNGDVRFDPTGGLPMSNVASHRRDIPVSALGTVVASLAEDNVSRIVNSGTV